MARYFAESMRDDEDRVPWPADDVIAAWMAEMPHQPPVVLNLDDVDHRPRARSWPVIPGGWRSSNLLSGVTP
jgi:hypothetical protein